MAKTQNLSWSDRFALINHFRPNDDKVCTVFNVTPDELATARELLQCGTFKINAVLDPSQYEGIFNVAAKEQAPATVTTHTRPAASASKAAKTPQKRGRKGDKIVKAFEAIGATPVPVDQFIKEHGVSLAVLRQSKRFDKVGPGCVNVKKDKATKTLMVWRSPTSIKE